LLGYPRTAQIPSLSSDPLAQLRSPCSSRNPRKAQTSSPSPSGMPSEGGSSKLNQRCRFGTPQDLPEAKVEKGLRRQVPKGCLHFSADCQSARFLIKLGFVMGKPEESIVKPAAFRGFSARRVLFLPVDTPGRLFERVLEEAAVKQRRLPVGCLFALKNRVVVLYGCVGAPAAVLWLESLISGGAEEILLLGICGSLHRRARLLDALLITHALSDEGTSPHYFPQKKEYHPSVELRDWVETVVHSRGLPYLPAAVVSTDAPYRETPSWRERCLDSGIDAVDMETSAVLALAEYHGLRAAALLIVSDELSDKGHRTGFAHPKIEETMSAYFLPFIREDTE